SAGGHLLWRLVQLHPGPDLIWGTADDTIGAASKAELRAPYDPFHYPLKVFFVKGAGPDGQWSTPDHALKSLRTFDCIDQVVIKNYSDVGPDGVWGSTDDV